MGDNWWGFFLSIYIYKKKSYGYHSQNLYTFFFNRSHNILVRHLQITIEKIQQTRDTITYKISWSSLVEWSWSHSGAFVVQLFEYFSKNNFCRQCHTFPFKSSIITRSATASDSHVYSLIKLGINNNLEMSKGDHG